MTDTSSDARRERQRALVIETQRHCELLQKTAKQGVVLRSAAIMTAWNRAQDLPGEFRRNRIRSGVDLFEALRLLANDDYLRRLTCLTLGVVDAWRSLCDVAASRAAIEADWAHLYLWLAGEARHPDEPHVAETNVFLQFAHTHRAAGRLLRIALSNDHIRLWESEDAPERALRQTMEDILRYGRDYFDLLESEAKKLYVAISGGITNQLTLSGGIAPWAVVAAFLSIGSEDALREIAVTRAVAGWEIAPIPPLKLYKGTPDARVSTSGVMKRKSSREWSELVAPSQTRDPDIDYDVAACGPLLQRHQTK